MRRRGNEQIEIGSQRLEDFYFLEKPEPFPDWVGKATTVAPVEWRSTTHLFTDDLTRTPHVRDALLELIRGAREKLFFCSFIFAEDEIVKALCEAAERLHGGVYVLTALEKEMQPDMSDLGEEISEYIRKREERRKHHDENLGLLARAGVWLRSSKECHAKFCVRDDEEAVVTSANATQQAYFGNPENGLRLREPWVARELGRLFAHVWLHEASAESQPGAELHVHSRTRENTPWRPLRRETGLWPVCTLGQHEHSIRERTLALIGTARRELVMASYSAVGLKGHAVGQALRRAMVERGVRVLLVVRSRNLSEDQRKTCAWLFEGLHPNQWCLRAHPLTHAKAIVADGERALVWTGNLDGHHGYEAGIEVGIETDQPPLAGTIREYVTALAARSSQVGEPYPTLTEVAATEVKSRVTGEWVLRLPEALAQQVPDLPQRLSRRLVGHFRLNKQWIIRVGPDLHLRASRDDKARVIILESVWNAPFLHERSLDGFFGGCTVEIVHLPPEFRAAHPQEGQGRRRKRRQRHR
ncbi:phospholipase D-like domain-containing protein [Archangium sp.]|uniref:phospholipase D-like domain-containing protein n=1 Tax=Archangium sp. TaxID=1872627 RepID=UPI00286D4203|nr:phospholipase D-like domain-containing protein [Archangium sp.]